MKEEIERAQATIQRLQQEVREEGRREWLNIKRENPLSAVTELKNITW